MFKIRFAESVERILEKFEFITEIGSSMQLRNSLSMNRTPGPNIASFSGM
jgi:hypothetical protein